LLIPKVNPFVLKSFSKRLNGEREVIQL